LSDIVSAAFSIPHKALKSGEVNQLVLKGGRGSAKSSYASIEGILLIIQNPEIHGVVMRKVANTLKRSVYNQYKWAIAELGLTDKFKCTVSPMEFTYKPTGQKIMFLGADDPAKLKSIKPQFGYIGYLHFEEIDHFGEEEVRNIEQSVLRGGALAYEIKTFNPPITRDNWANKYCLREKEGQLIHHSTYLTTPTEWLGERFLNDAEYLKSINPKAYEHEYLGIPVGTGGNVFENVDVREIRQKELDGLDRYYFGVDWGWFPDCWAYVKCAYVSSSRTLYILDEAMAYKKSNYETYEILTNEKGVTPDDDLICDSSEPKSTKDYQEYGLRARGAEKGAGSVNYSMKWLQGLTKVIIDNGKCPNTAKEYLEYEYERARDGSIITGYPDKNNHFIDATRYALNLLWRRPGE
jgi:PBSX family phage terminase large subunit